MPTGIYERTPEHRANVGTALLGNHNTLKHGHASLRTPTYITWVLMRQRCSNSNLEGYKYYGARGISVCAAWGSFETFLSDMGERPDGQTIDRIDNDGNYEPGNVRWATSGEQAANRGPRRAKR